MKKVTSQSVVSAWMMAGLILSTGSAPAAEVEELVKSNVSWDGRTLPAYPAGSPEVTILRITVAPGERLPLHTHPVINAGVLTKGGLTVVTADDRKLYLKAGDPIVEVVDTWHYGVNEGSEPAEIVVFYAGITGEPITVKEELDRSLFKGYTTALLIHNRTTGRSVNADAVLSARRLSPCSTFKIYNTIIGLESGLLNSADAPWYEWDSVTREIPAWNQDLTLRQAFTASCVPAYQGLAREIGPERMKRYIEQIDYGNQDISAGIDIFWLGGPAGESILISANEQVALLNKLLDGALPFTQENIAILKDIMTVVKTDKGTLYGKTGSGRTPAKKASVGWFVGFLEHGTDTYTFACNITDGEDPSGKEARAIIESVFRSQGLL
jgi:beta-lactamase class D